MDFRILGPIEVLSGSEQLRLGGPRQRALLAYLLLHEGEVVQAGRLVEELWHDPPAGGIAALHSHVSRLRRIVDHRIATAGAGYALHLDEADSLDLALFRARLADAGNAADPAVRARLLRDADALWHGTPFDGLDVPFVSTETVALEELRVGAIEERVEAELDAGHDGDLVSELSTLVSHHPLRERLRRQWILALYRSGRQADALEAHRETRRMFDEELGLELTPALAELERAILQHDPSLAPKARPVPAPVVRRRRRGVVVGLAAAAIAVVAAGAGTAVVVTDDEPSTTVAVKKPFVPRAPRRMHLVAAHRTVGHHAVGHHAVRHHVVPTPVAQPTPTVTIATTTYVSTPPVTTVRHAAPAQPAVHVTTTTPVAQKKAPPAPKPVTIADDFNGTSVDPLIWSQSIEGTTPTIAEQGGQIEFTLPIGTTPDPGTGYYGANATTLCKFPRDFDARVDYSLAQWPAENGVSVILWAFMGPRSDPWSASRSSHGQETYDANVGTWINVPDSDVSGSLRVARHDGEFAAYFMHTGAWVKIAGAPNTGVAALAVGVVSKDNRPNAVVVDFDNFRVSGVKPLCPPGSPFSP